MRVLATLIFGLAFSWSALAGEIRPRGEGLPLPWPFPWAKECPVNWKSVQGRYSLSDSANNEEIDLRIKILTKKGFRLVRISRYDWYGHIISDGFAFLSENQRTISVYLQPVVDDEPPMWAILKFHYWNENFGCAENQLVPILTLEKLKQNHSTQTQYRLVRIYKHAKPTKGPR